MNEEVLARLRLVAPLRLDEPLSRHTTFGVGGPADVYLAADTEEQLRDAFVVAHTARLPVFILGAGTNILVGDGGIRGLVIENRTSQVDGPSPNGSGFRVRVASGVSFAAVARRLCLAGYAGLDWAIGIPGTMGGATVSNAGAYGSCLEEVLKSVRLVDGQGNVAEVHPDELALTYRSSAFTSGLLQDRVVLSVDLSVQVGDAEALRRQVSERDAQRKGAQPAGRNCGSMFKNPAENPAWWLIDQVGLRGHRIGNAQISELHTNFTLNLGGATAADVIALMELARSRVRQRFGIELESEVALVGEFV
ncbi:MAG: UDP-N-acetylmuramate dehydrogenase [Dehalococcoidia bacterium]